MAERRSLGAALSISPEKRAFIEGAALNAPANAAEVQKVAPKVERTAAPVKEPEPVLVAEEPIELTEEATPERVGVGRSARRTRQRRQVRSEAPTEMAAFPGLTNLLVPLTTRLQPATAAALKRAGLEQRLKGAQPATVQEIAEEAIQFWLEENGYL